MVIIFGALVSALLQDPPFSLFSGRDFVVPPGGRFVKAVAKLMDNDSAQLQSNPVPFNNNDVVFDSELMW